MMQSPIFVIGLVVENALEKNCKLWLVLQDMYTAYNSVDGSLSSLGTLGIMAGTAAFFEDIGLDINMKIFGLVFSTMVELQTIALALDVSDNEHADALARAAIFSDWHLSHMVKEHFLRAKDMTDPKVAA
ncbi:hypothetical protein G9A89_008762 [Geosiphon pyriformis]|nr:hypothetical protein G9A89_008762 [Geosiphon pyriformis]